MNLAAPVTQQRTEASPNPLRIAAHAQRGPLSQQTRAWAGNPGQKDGGMTRYIVWRHGANAENQPLAEHAILGTFDSYTRLNQRGLERQNAKETLSLWCTERGEAVYANQHLTYKPFPLCSQVERATAEEMDEWHASHTDEESSPTDSA